MDVIDQLIAHWKSQPEIERNPGATDVEIQAFEQRHGVTLPDDLQASLKHANGVVEYAEHLAEFYGLDQIVPASVRYGLNHELGLFLIGGAMNECPAYVIGLHETNRGVVFEIDGASDHPMPQVASSYSNFVSMYLADPDSLLCLSGYAEQQTDRPEQTLYAPKIPKRSHTMHVHYLEFVTPDVDAVCATYARIHDATFSDPVPELGNARTATMSHGGTLGVRAPMSDTESPIQRTYLLVEDIEVAAKAAADSGAKIALPPTEIPGRGRVVIYIQCGVEHGLWQK